MESVQARKVEHYIDVKQPGDFCFVKRDGVITGLGFYCPCGQGDCIGKSVLPIRPVPEESIQHPSWEWDGNEDRPTLTPSIRRTGTCQWHGYLRNGVFEPC